MVIVPGHGAIATVEGRRVVVGNRRLMETEGVDIGLLAARREELTASGRTAVIVGVDGQAMGLVAGAGAVRPSSAAAVTAVAALQGTGVEVVMLTGDNAATARRIADTLGIDIGAGTDVAFETADVVLMGSDPLDVATGLAIGRGTRRKMRQNLGWAGRLQRDRATHRRRRLRSRYGLILRPEIAAPSMSGSSFIVAVNALALERLRLPKAPI